MSPNPAAAKTSASPTLPAVMPTAPASTWRRPISTHLCVLTCGRTSRSCWAAKPCMRSMLSCMTSTSTIGAGVSTRSTSVSSARWSRFTVYSSLLPRVPSRWSRSRQAKDDGEVGDVGDPLVAEPRLVVLEAPVHVHLVLDTHDRCRAEVVHRTRGDVHDLLGCRSELVQHVLERTEPRLVDTHLLGGDHHIERGLEILHQARRMRVVAVRHDHQRVRLRQALQCLGDAGVRAPGGDVVVHRPRVALAVLQAEPAQGALQGMTD